MTSNIYHFIAYDVSIFNTKKSEKQTNKQTTISVHVFVGVGGSHIYFLKLFYLIKIKTEGQSWLKPYSLLFIHRQTNIHYSRKLYPENCIYTYVTNINNIKTHQKSRNRLNMVRESFWQHSKCLLQCVIYRCIYVQIIFWL